MGVGFLEVGAYLGACVAICVLGFENAEVARYQLIHSPHASHLLSNEMPLESRWISDGSERGHRATPSNVAEGSACVKFVGSKG
jgi:hypothetical protein